MELYYFISFLFILTITDLGAAIRCFQCVYSEIEGDASIPECGDPFDVRDRGSIPVPEDCDSTLEAEELAIRNDPRCVETRNKRLPTPDFCLLPLNKTYTHCRIMWITINTIRSKPMRIVRQCATDLAKRHGKLHYYTGTVDTHTEVYHCDYDECNNVAESKSNFFVVVVVGVSVTTLALF